MVFLEVDFDVDFVCLDFSYSVVYVWVVFVVCDQ